MKKQDAIRELAERAGLNQTQAAAAFDVIFDAEEGIISRTLKTGGKFSIPGFGAFVARVRKARTGRNPKTGAEIKIPASTGAAFTAAKGLKDRLNG